jgi:CxxC-x17-CxxC domain-containing protein
MYREDGRGGSRFGGGGPREMHKATCADCGKECEVPFKPDGSKPVYCRDCYQKHRPPKRF